MPRVVAVVFVAGGRRYDFDAGDLKLVGGDRVVVDTQKGKESGIVVGAPVERDDEAANGGLRRVVRKITAADDERLEQQRDDECEAKAAARDLARQLGLAMKVIAAKKSFDGNKLTVSFVAEQRVDFRELVTKLHERFKCRVELKQVSARDGARMVGGFGPCGRPLCCASFAGDEEPVSIRMAKDQNLPLNPTKISGCCGRLMCCLKYEHQVYVDFRKQAPRRGATVTTPGGDGRVVDAQATADTVVVDHGGRTVTYRLAEIGKGGADKPTADGADAAAGAGDQAEA